MGPLMGPWIVVSGLGVLLAVAARALPAMVTFAMLATTLRIPMRGLAVAERHAPWEFAGAFLTLLTLMGPAVPRALQASTLLPLGPQAWLTVRSAPLQTTAPLDLLPQFPALLVHTALQTFGPLNNVPSIHTLLRARQAFYPATSAMLATSPTKTWAPEKLHAAHAQRAIPQTLVTNSAQLAQRESTPMQWVAFASHAHRGAMGTQPK